MSEISSRKTAEQLSALLLSRTSPVRHYRSRVADSGPLYRYAVFSVPLGERYGEDAARERVAHLVVADDSWYGPCIGNPPWETARAALDLYGFLGTVIARTVEDALHAFDVVAK